MGAPTKYKPEFCEQLIEHMAKGFSFESFGALAHCSGEVLHDWVKKHDEFSEAKAIGISYSLLTWEALGIKIAKGEVETTPAVYIFTMKNKFGWVDKKDINHTGQLTLEKLIEKTVGDSERELKLVSGKKE